MTFDSHDNNSEINIYGSLITNHPDALNGTLFLMANYTYKKEEKAAKSWIDIIYVMDPVTSASNEYTEIHFTTPKTAQVELDARPHVTFVRNGTKTHWYLSPKNGAWVVVFGGSNARSGEDKIAQNVVDDMVSYNYIFPPAQSTLVDDDGFTTVESKKSKKNRVITSWQ